VVTVGVLASGVTVTVAVSVGVAVAVSEDTGSAVTVAGTTIARKGISAPSSTTIWYCQVPSSSS